MTPSRGSVRRVIFASALGTLFEWYDFFLYGALAPVIARHFFSSGTPGSSFLLALLAFAAGFAIRPFGALMFGRLGDIIGRKYTFLITILLMGMSTFVVGLLPGFTSIGTAAPLILLSVRLLQGLALGGEYGGAATYVAEHAPIGRHGAYTGLVQTTATVGLLLALVMVVGLRALLGEATFNAWGWRLCFLLSSMLLGISVWIRLQLDESPAFLRIKRAGRTSPAPIREAFGEPANLRVILLALFGLCAGQGAVWYGGQFYAFLFLTQTLKVDISDAATLLGIALLIATPFFWIFAALSDRVGRKPMILTGFAIAVVGYFPLFHALAAAANPAFAHASRVAPVILEIDPSQCTFRFSAAIAHDPARTCNAAREALAAAGVSFDHRSTHGPARIIVGTRIVPVTPVGQPEGDGVPELNARIDAALRGAGYPAVADPAAIDRPKVTALLVLLALDAALVYGPLAAALCELFPTRIRYTSMSLPYHIGNGWFGGVLPTVAIALVAWVGNIDAGLWYPVAIAAMSLVVGLIFLPETRGRGLDAFD